MCLCSRIIIIITALFASRLPPIPLDFLPTYTGLIIVVLIFLFGGFLIWKSSYNELDADLFAAQKIGRDAAIVAMKTVFPDDEAYRKSFKLFTSYVGLTERVNYIKKKMNS